MKKLKESDNLIHNFPNISQIAQFLLEKITMIIKK